jgi:PAS domain S-box-containing protein
VFVSTKAALAGYYDYGEVARSVFTSIAASYAALDLTGRVTAARGRISLAWLTFGAVAVGLGIWAMHFEGILAYHLPVPVEYHWPTLLVALLVAIFGSAFGVYVASRQKMGWREALTGSVIMGAGLAGFHYIAMAAMRLAAVTRYSPLLVTASVLVAALFCLIALLMAFQLREETRWTVPRRLGAAILMGAAVSAMHYTGMAAASFIPGPLPNLTHAVSISALGNNAIEVIALIVVAAAMVTSSVDRRARVEFGLDQELERRVRERAKQLTVGNVAIGETEERFRRMVEALPDAIFVIREERIVFVNPSAVRLLAAQRPEQIVGKELSEIVHPDSLASMERRMRDSHRTEVVAPPMEDVLVALDGSSVEIESATIPILWEGAPAIEAIVRDISERKRAQARLREYEKAVEGLEEMIVVVDRNYRYVLANRAFLKYRGLEKEQLLGRLVSEVLNPGVFEEIAKEKLDECFRGKIVSYELRYRYPELGERDLSISYFPIEGADGVDRVACVLQDISDRKQAEEALRTSEREQHRITEQLETERVRLIEAQAVANVGSWETELPSLEITWSEQTYRIFETDPSRFHSRRQDFMERVHPEDRAKVDLAFEASLQKGAPSRVEYRIVMADGRVKVLEERWKVFLDGQGHPARLIGTCQDITERKRAEAALRESEARFRLVADRAPVMIWMSGTDKLCNYFNKPWLDFRGRSIDQVLGQAWGEGVEPEDLQRCLETYTQAFNRREAFRIEYQLRRYDGEYRLVSDIGVPRFNPDGSFAGFIGSCIDVTEQRRGEEQLRQAREDLARITRILAMGELAAAIAHEVNQPLTAIVTNANFSLRELNSAIPDVEELRGAITEIVNDGARASTVISRIRGLLTRGVPRATETNINQVIQDVILLLGYELNRNRISLRTELAAELPPVQGDPVQLQQVLINLIMNAVDALRTCGDRPREILIRSAKNSEGILVQVEDSGPGVRQEQADRIFEPFFTTKPQGIGIGLSISRSIVESHGGRLWAAPGELQGARFQFTVRIAATSDERAA